MNPLLSELDHAMLAVREHAPAIEAWQRLGFLVRPVRQLAPMGGGSAGGNGGSAAVLLHSSTPGCCNYIEIARADPRTAAPALQRLLCGPPGVAMLVHATPDPTQLAGQWAAQGWHSQSIDLELAPMGPGPLTKVQVVLPQPGQTRMMFNAMRMSSTVDFERDEWRAHPNTALRWSGITYLESPQHLIATCELLTVLYGAGIQQIDAEAWSHQPGSVRLSLMSEAAFCRRFGSIAQACPPDRPRGVMLSFEVKHLEVARKHLMQQQVPYVGRDGSLLIPASPLLGVAMELIASA
jgi:hypothetical protein